jgi:imidazolonepropionase-like amidohydrolase
MTKSALRGRVVTMDDAAHVITDGAVYISDNAIVAVKPASDPRPAGFEQVEPALTSGTIYPGLVELHNHLSYNALPLWSVPKRYDNRDQWPQNPEYHALVTGPMKLLGDAKRKDLLAALVRYVESKALFGGITTTQGVALASNAGVETYYHGVVRNVESTGDKALPAARTHIADVEAKDWDKFHKAVSGNQVVILHLSEGVDTKAREHFLALQKGGNWAITDKLVGIHCAGLQAQDFDTMAKHGGSMVWSPFSNYLLYGDTANVAAARKSGVTVALGSDWSPSGSKNLLGELKVARLAADEHGWDISNHDLVAMVTRNPAKMLKWNAAIGSIEAGKRADLLVLAQAKTDPYRQLIDAQENDITLVVIDGVARYGTAGLMTALGAKSTKVEVAGVERHVMYHDASANPDIDSVSLAVARTTLHAFFKGLGGASPMTFAAAAPANAQPSKLTLALPEIDGTKTQRPLLPYHGKPTGWSPAALMAAAVTQAISAIEIDPLTVLDDGDFVQVCVDENNLPPWLKTGLKKILS